MRVEKLLTDHIDIWSCARQTRATAGRGSSGKIDLYGIKKLRELILELAVRGKLVPQDPNDEPASELLKRIAAEKAELVKQGKIKKQKPLPEIREEEKPFELPEGWEWVRLIDLGTWALGSGFPASIQGVANKEILMCKVSDMNLQGNEKFIISTNNTISEDVALQKKINVSDPGTIIFPKIGGAIATNKRRILIKKTAIDNNCLGIKPFNSLNVEWFFLILNSIDMAKYQSGTSVPAINQSIIGNIVVALPPTNMQKHIARKVEELMSLCDQLEQQSLTSLDAHQQLVETLLATLTDSQNTEELTANWARISQHFDTLFTTEASIDALKQTILQLAVMGKLVPQDPDDEPASELLKRIEQEKAQWVKEGKIKKRKSFLKKGDGKIYELPNGWVKCPLGDIITISSGDGLTSKQMAVDGNIPVYGGNGITGYHDNWNVDKPTIVIGRVGYYCGSVHITPSLAWVTDNAFITYYSKNNIDACFLSLLLKGTNLKENENATAQPVISGSKIYPIEIMLPPLNEQKKIVRKFFELNCLCDTLKSRLQSAQQTQLHLADALTEAALN